MIKKGFILLLCFQAVVFSQFKNDSNNTFQKENLLSTLQSDASLSLKTSLRLLQSPYFFDKNDILMTGIVISITGASSTLDNKVRGEVSRSHNMDMDKITNIGEQFGNGTYGIALSGILYTVGLVFSDPYTRETGQMLAEAMICNGIYSQLFKITLGRARPYTGNPNYEIEPFQFEFESAENSLPSGHTSTAFTIATVLSERINNTYASIALYSLASLTAYQRIYADVHWLSDTVLGAALGTFIGLKIVNLHEKTSTPKEAFTLNVFPQFNSNSYGVNLTFKF